ncbi:MAG: hypothetical protein LBT86_03575 [Deltaproteobacteria bacterium]|nr:hypothetical protein [Deltaproteobacteria bacterium]
MEDFSHLTCQGCGANIELKPNQKKVTCPYCGVENSLFAETPSGVLEPELVVPAGVDQKSLHDFIHRIMIQDEMAPDDILEVSHIESETIAFYPCFVAKGSFSANWTASFGYDRQESYTEYETQYIGKTSRRVPVTKYRTVTDWRPGSGEAKGDFLVAVYGGSDLPVAVAGLVSRINLGSLTAFQPGHVAGYDLNPITMTTNEALGAARPLIESEVGSAVYEHAQGDHQRDWNWDSVIQNEYLKPALAPLAHGVFSYKGKNYQIWSDGVSLSSLYTDKLPQDSQRGRDIQLSYGPLVLSGLVALVSCFLVKAPFWPWPIIIGLAGAWLFGYLRSRAIKNHSRKTRAASLARKKLEEAGGDQQTEEERQALYQTSVNPVQPFLARTGHDLIVIPLVTLLILSAVLVGVFHKRLVEMSFFSQSSSPKVSTASKASPSESASSASKAFPTESASSAKEPSPVDRPYFKVDNLKCAAEPPLFCATFDGQPVNGFVLETATENGRLYPKKFSKYVNGRPEGIGLILFPNGQVEWRLTYEKGNLRGPAIKYYPQSTKSAEPVVEIVNFFLNNQLDGVRAWFDHQGRLNSVVDRFVNGQANGVWRQFYPDGSVQYAQNYVNGKMSGSREEFKPGQHLLDYQWLLDGLRETSANLATAARPIERELIRSEILERE